MRRNDLVGRRFAGLEVVGIHDLCKKKNVRWKCRCDCGGTAIAYAYDLKSGRVKSCGCLRFSGNARVQHGLARAGKRRSKEYSLWAAMVQRCTNPKDRNWASYGARGISICDSWLSFEKFYADMGQAPHGKSLDRIDNIKGYSLDNCRWASLAEQARNKRSNIWVCVKGTKMVLQDAMRLLKIPKSSIYKYRKQYNFSPQEALDLWLQRKNLL